MKRISIFLALILALVAFSGCRNHNVTYLMVQVDEANKECPSAIGPDAELHSVTYDEDANEVIFTFTIKDKTMWEGLKKSDMNVMKNNLRTTEGESNSLLNAAVSAGSTIKFVCKLSGSKESFSITITNEELKKMHDNPATEEEINLLTLESSAESFNSECPQSFCEGVTMTKVAVESTCLVYYLECDPNFVDLVSIEVDRPEYTSILMDGILSAKSDPYVQEEFKLMKSLNMCYVYRFYSANPASNSSGSASGSSASASAPAASNSTASGSTPIPEPGSDQTVDIIIPIQDILSRL